jgi:ABC-type enterobactin transport system permease subunit
MRLIAISVVVLAGAVMAAAGTIAEAMPPDAKRYCVVDEWGLFLVAGGLLLFAADLWHMWREVREEAGLGRRDRIVEATVGIAEALR